MRAIGEAVRAGVPYFGACLGVQLLAAALGARVYTGAAPEVGLLPVELTPEGRADPVLGALPDGEVTLQWHGDSFDLPEGATLLASSPLYANQAFRFGDCAYGVQFHIEVSLAMAREWAAVPAYAASLERTEGPGALPRLIAQVEAAEQGMLSVARDLFARWYEVATQHAADDERLGLRRVSAPSRGPASRFTKSTSSRRLGA